MTIQPRSTFMSKQDGYIIINTCEGPNIEHDTKQCIHCGGHFIMVKGSGVLRGYCSVCDGLLCGKRHCMEVCQHYKAKLGV